MLRPCSMCAYRMTALPAVRSKRKELQVDNRNTGFLTGLRRELVGPPDFYKHVLIVAVPIMVQNAITNIVGMPDNIMVGQIGTDAMSGVSIVNQLLFVFYLCIFGGLSGIGIFTAQFYGKKDFRGMQYTMRAKLLLAVFITAAGTGILLLFHDGLIGMFLHEGGSTGSIEETLHQAKIYLNVMYAGLLPMAVSNVYASTLRETGETMVPMRAGILAVLVNLAGNYILIYGKFGAPALGVVGAALATVLSRFVECFYVMIWTHRNTEKHPYITGCFRSFRIPMDLTRQFVVKGLPLLVNEALWSTGMTFLTQCYSVRGLSVVAAFNISNTLTNVFNIVFLAMGNATAILLGQELGAGRTRTVRTYAWRLAAFSVFLSVGTGVGLFLTAPLFPGIYNTTQEVKLLAAGLLRVSACCMLLYAFNNNTYFTLRSGGKTFITFLFDSCFCWAVAVPTAFVLSRYTSMPVVWLFLIVQLTEIIKSVLGFILVRQGKWIHDLTEYSEQK